MHRNCCVCHVKLLKKSVSDHYSVDFLEKGRVFKLESLFRVVYPTINIIIRLVGQVYHFRNCSSKLAVSDWKLKNREFKVNLYGF